MRDLGRNVFGIAAFTLGAIALIWGDFAIYWQPVPDTVPGHALLVWAASLILLAGGGALQWPRSARAGAIAIALPYAAFALLWARRMVGFPQIFATWSGTCEELALVIACVALVAAPACGAAGSRTLLACRIGLGICALLFGGAHFFALQETASLVPAWLPAGTRFWALLTGVCDIAAGLALVTGIMALLAARLLAAMFGVFQLLVWAPRLWETPGDHIAWAGNAINLALVGAVWVIADRAGGLSGLWPVKRGNREA